MIQLQFLVFRENLNTFFYRRIVRRNRLVHFQQFYELFFSAYFGEIHDEECGDSNIIHDESGLVLHVRFVAVLGQRTNMIAAFLRNEQ
jgi:hypothetical protein